MTFARCDMNS